MSEVSECYCVRDFDPISTLDIDSALDYRRRAAEHIDALRVSAPARRVLLRRALLLRCARDVYALGVVVTASQVRRAYRRYYYPLSQVSSPYISSVLRHAGWRWISRSVGYLPAKGVLPWPPD